LKNQDPLFVDYTVNDLQLDSISPARDIGKIEIANTVPTDLKGVDRLESPDIGAYEWIPVIEIKKR
ncbi:MAG: choice-of-anchor Q domain-containing protein, partial [Bacteroidales bacterium]